MIISTTLIQGHHRAGPIIKPSFVLYKTVSADPAALHRSSKGTKVMRIDVEQSIVFPTSVLDNMIRVAIAGGGGNFGRTILDVLSKQDEHEAFVLSRKVC